MEELLKSVPAPGRVSHSLHSRTTMDRVWEEGLAGVEHPGQEHEHHHHKHHHTHRHSGAQHGAAAAAAAAEGQAQQPAESGEPPAGGKGESR